MSQKDGFSFTQCTVDLHHLLSSLTFHWRGIDGACVCLGAGGGGLPGGRRLAALGVQVRVGHDQSPGLGVVQPLTSVWLLGGLRSGPLLSVSVVESTGRLHS